MGTFCTFQGFPVFEVVFERSRGYAPGGALIVIAAEAFPDGFDFRTPAPGALATPKATPGVVVGGTTPTTGGTVGPATLARALDYEGFLVMSETLNGDTWEMPPIRLFVVSVSTRKQAGERALIEIVARDERLHWELGWCRRHSYNRKRPDGTIALDSVGEDGKPVTKRQIVEDVARAMFRAPKVSRVPAEWETDTSSVQFVPNAPPVVNLAQMINAADLEEPCLRLDGSIALYKAGEGGTGTAPSAGAENLTPFTEWLKLSKGGQGERHSAEWVYPEEYVLVAGGVRVVTVAIDDAVPVLDIDGATYNINDETVRFLTNGRYDEAWLRRFVFLPADFAGAPDLPEPIANVFRTQAYRLWQVRDVEVERQAGLPDDAPQAAAGPEAEGDAALDAEGAALTADLGFGGAPPPAAPAAQPQRRVVREPGPNAHLLPVQPRAETQAGRRLPPTVQTYTFAIRHRALAGGGALALQQAAIREMSRLRDDILRAANTQGNPNPFTARETFFDPFGTGRREDQTDALTGKQELTIGRDALSTDRPGAVEARRLLQNAGVSVGELEAALKQARVVERIGENAGAGFAQQYENALRQRLSAEDEAQGGSKQQTLYDLAKKFIELEGKANSDGSAFSTTQQAFRELGLDGAMAQEIQNAARKLQIEKEERERRTQVGGREGADVPSQTYFVNVARTVDAGARVYDAERGIFETSGLAGHLVDVNIHDLSHPAAELSVCPVRLVFGATLRPRLDIPYRAVGRVQTGDEDGDGEADTIGEGGDCPGGDNVAPKALNDSETFYLAAFQRGPSGGAIPVDPFTVPDGQMLVVRRPDLVELVGLDGTSNRAALDAEAGQIAAELFRARPLVRSSSLTLARPWPVNCDGIVQRVEVVMRRGPSGAPCGFETTVYTGTGALNDAAGGTREDPARRGAAALKAQNEAAKRERAS